MAPTSLPSPAVPETVALSAVDRAAAAVSHALADRWVADLDGRPFRPTPDQLVWVAGHDLDEHADRDRRVPVAASRFASLFADHVTGDLTVRGGPGAYVRIWLCARRAFIDSLAGQTTDGGSGGGIARTAASTPMQRPGR
jgi:hypothetical protein